MARFIYHVQMYHRQQKTSTIHPFLKKKQRKAATAVISGYIQGKVEAGKNENVFEFFLNRSFDD